MSNLLEPYFLFRKLELMAAPWGWVRISAALAQDRRPVIDNLVMFAPGINIPQATPGKSLHGG